MAYSDVFSKIWAILNHFNSRLNEFDKLDEKALKTIQNYLNDPKITFLKQGDEKKVQCSLKELELLNDQVTLTRVKSTDMKDINRQIRRLAEMIKKRSEQTNKDAYFVIIKLKVCFSKLLSEEAISSSKQWQKFYEEKTGVKMASDSSDPLAHSHFLRMVTGQRLIDELMNAALSGIIEYFQDKNESFADHFTQMFLDSLENMMKNPDRPVENKIRDDVMKILVKTAETCKLPISFLISQFRYSIIRFDETTNQFSMPLLKYITNTEFPTLMEFNKTIDFPAALSSEDVNQYDPLFQMYCEKLFTSQCPELISTEAMGELVDSPKPPLSESTDELTNETYSAINVFLKQLVISEPTSKPLVKTPMSESCSSTSKGKLLTSAPVGKPIQFCLPPASKIYCETDLKFIWITSNTEHYDKDYDEDHDEDYYEDYFHDYATVISPRASIPCSGDEFRSHVSNDSRIFLCVRATQAHDLLSRIHREPALYLVYILCENKAEEDRIQREVTEFNKVRIITSNREEFLGQLGVDVVSSFIELGNIELEGDDTFNARRWYEAALRNVNTYGGSLKNFLLPTINKKLQQC